MVYDYPFNCTLSMTDFIFTKQRWISLELVLSRNKARNEVSYWTVYNSFNLLFDLLLFVSDSERVNRGFSKPLCQRFGKHFANNIKRTDLRETHQKKKKSIKTNEVGIGLCTFLLIADFSPIHVLMWSFDGFLLYFGEFWSVEFIETRVLMKTEHRPKRDPSKQSLKYAVSFLVLIFQALLRWVSIRSVLFVFIETEKSK